MRRLERLLSRFDPESELSRLNRRGEAHVGPELLELAGGAPSGWCSSNERS